MREHRWACVGHGLPKIKNIAMTHNFNHYRTFDNIEIAILILIKPDIIFVP